MPKTNLNIMQLVNKYGYPMEKHEVETSDGYLLNMFRIPNAGPPVLLMHGILSSVDDFFTIGSNSGIGYLLADVGYDVWLGNARGNKHSRRHVTLSPDCEEFWDFSFDEIGRYDLPAKIDYILNKTNEEQLTYIGHMGCTVFFVLCSELPEYNSKIKLMIAFSAVAFSPYTSWLTAMFSRRPLSLPFQVRDDLSKQRALRFLNGFVWLKI
ncbi:LOW QUALITY PROTEIN: lysosomal acid lipase/cholesteryl ester hydrolase-like [Aphomia sociella]